MPKIEITYDDDPDQMLLTLLMAGLEDVASRTLNRMTDEQIRDLHRANMRLSFLLKSQYNERMMSE